MKRILTLSAVLLLFIGVRAQDVKKILGTWEIKNFQYSDHPDNNEKNTPFRKYKTYTPTNFIVTEINNSTNITTTSIFGTYEFKDGIYTEKIISVNRESAGMIGQTFSFKVTFEEDDKMRSVGSFNGMETSEFWVRVKDGKETERIPTGVKIPLSVIKNGEKYLILKSGNEKEMILRQIEQNDIEAIQVLKDQSATALFGEPGKNGVIILSLKAGRLEPVLEYLKTKGITTVEQNAVNN